MPVLLRKKPGAADYMVSALTGCAGQRNPTLQNYSSEMLPSAQNNAAYEKLIAYKTGNYRQQRVADFSAALALTPDELTKFLATVADVGGTISPDDENYDFFTTTITFSSHELYCEHMGETFTLFMPLSKQSRICDYLDEDGEPVYDFTCFVEATAAYSIDNPELVSVAERDQALLTFREKMQHYLNDLNEEKITDSDIGKMLTEKPAGLAKNLSTEYMKLSPCEIYLLEINDAGTEIAP